MKKYPFILALTSLVYFLSIPLLSAGTVVGLVQAPKRVKKVIVYLKREKPAKQNEPVQKHLVSQKDTHFKPALWIISEGDSIEWANNETKEIDHNIFSLNALNRFDLGLGAKGSKLAQSFSKSGVLNYYCSIHKEMEGKIIILPSRYYQLLDKPTHFKIKNLPEGKWILDAVVLHRRYKAVPIKLTIGKDTVNNLNLSIVKR